MRRGEWTEIEAERHEDGRTQGCIQCPSPDLPWTAKSRDIPMSEKEHFEHPLLRIGECECIECGTIMLGRLGDTCRCQGRLVPVAVLVALQFYADPIRYNGPNQHASKGERHMREPSYLLDVTADRGALASAALAALTKHSSQ